ncbi:MAG TPA: hypothetical protein VFX96_06205 [Pyrinomonadaceae bacterium]|nr:hypothetical protein [Pyrinomonadaceae bacterium]
MRTRLTALLVVLSLLLVAPLGVAAAKDKDAGGLSVPVSGTFTDLAGGVGKFNGTLNITRFAAVGNRVHALGTVAGTLTDSQGNVVATGLQTVSLPVTLAGGQAAAVPARQKSSDAPVKFTKASYGASGEGRAYYVGAAAPAQLSCEILRLSIGTIDLDLLGLTVHLNPVLLIVSAVPGAGNLLGNLLCAIVGLLDGVGTLVQIVNLLNQLLALLATL